ncbi:phosphatase PAP2 family protein [Leuconostoc palmae]|uniref:phosphatase PAP2 family protein n=1 Tax=Leuconostoc palmae TaxID=501487 RepID=UPI001C7D6EE0|nr:phosphatase PAP2 family protein [Leuconostoc palmae]
MIISVTNKQRRYALINLVILLLLTILVKLNFIIPVGIDNIFHNLFNNLQSGFGDIVMTVAAFLGNPIVDFIYILALTGVLIIAKLRIPAIWAILTILSGNIVLKIFQIIINRPRPMGHLLSDSSASFPSSYIFGLFVVIFIIKILVIPNVNTLLTQIVMNWVIILIGLMAIMSRIYFNAHFVSDTVASVMFAYSWVIFSATCYGKLAHYLKKRLVLLENDEI